MTCIWAGTLNTTWGVIATRQIVKNMVFWASRILRPQVSAYLSLIRFNLTSDQPVEDSSLPMPIFAGIHAGDNVHAYNDASVQTDNLPPYKTSPPKDQCNNREGPNRKRESVQEGNYIQGSLQPSSRLPIGHNNDASSSSTPAADAVIRLKPSPQQMSPPDVRGNPTDSTSQSTSLFQHEVAVNISHRPKLIPVRRIFGKRSQFRPFSLSRSLPRSRCDFKVGFFNSPMASSVTSASLRSNGPYYTSNGKRIIVRLPKANQAKSQEPGALNDGREAASKEFDHLQPVIHGDQNFTAPTETCDWERGESQNATENEVDAPPPSYNESLQTGEKEDPSVEPQKASGADSNSWHENDSVQKSCHGEDGYQTETPESSDNIGDITELRCYHKYKFKETPEQRPRTFLITGFQQLQL